MNGRFLQEVASADVVIDDSLVCVTSGNGRSSSCRTYYKVVKDYQVINKIKQAFRFLFNQMFGRKGHSEHLSETGTIFSNVVTTDAIFSFDRHTTQSPLIRTNTTPQITGVMSVIAHRPPAPLNNIMSEPPSTFAQQGSMSMKAFASSEQMTQLVGRQRRDEYERATVLLQRARSRLPVVSGNMDAIVLHRAIIRASIPSSITSLGLASEASQQRLKLLTVITAVQRASATHSQSDPSEKHSSVGVTPRPCVKRCT
ncbi:hypothetical protein IV203_033283 [Nitzschia inconspicua]|uniref:Uncharacterized protein n=1 Tax=Nitzschia inconspicua TaxID=303405 RepID=A0A9K3KL82_9STRA|nr:hypothetical protein IV203_033283 [Nitzschia inconspicua]